jgi:hypothetical protein
LLGSSTRRRTSVPIAALVCSPGTIVAIALMHRRVTLKGAVAAHAQTERIVIAKQAGLRNYYLANFEERRR